jgi:tetratricopeptide (TPR) repeat protein
VIDDVSRRLHEANRALSRIPFGDWGGARDRRYRGAGAELGRLQRQERPDVRRKN